MLPIIMTRGPDSQYPKYEASPSNRRDEQTRFISVKWDRPDQDLKIHEEPFIIEGHHSSTKGSDWIRLLFAHPFPLNSGAPIASANFI